MLYSLRSLRGTQRKRAHLRTALTAVTKAFFVLFLLIITSCSKSEVQKKIEQHETASKALFNESNVSNHKEAFDYLYSEYQNGSAYSAGKVGWAYQKGLGVEQDIEKAIELYEFAARRGIGSHWVDRRLIFLRGLVNEQKTWIFSRSTGTRGSVGFNH